MSRRINNLGYLASGAGDSIVSLNNIPIGLGGAAQWEFADGRSILYNGHAPDGSGWKLLRYIAATGKTDIVSEGGNSLAVSEGRWACMTNNGLVTNFPVAPGTVMSLCGTDGRGASGPNGLIALCTDQSCTRVAIYAPGSAAPIDFIDAVAYGLSLVDRYIYIWSGGSKGITLYTLPMLSPKLVTVAGEDWLVGWINGIGLVAQPNAKTMGYILGSDGHQFDHDAQAVNNKLVVCYSYENNEAPGQNTIVFVDLTKPRVPIKIVTPPTLPDPPYIPNPIPTPPPPKPVPVIIPSTPRATEPHMIAYGPVLTGFTAADKIVDNGNGTVSVQKLNGQFLCVTPEGKIEERPSGGGVWESFVMGAAGLIALRETDHGDITYVLPLLR